MPSVLDEICQGLLNQARLQPGQLVAHDLGRGLRIQVKIANNLVHLYLSRSSNYPSEGEFKTVLHHWPWAVKRCDVMQQVYNRRFFLYGSLPDCQ